MEKLTFDSPAIQSYLSILQGVINRMSSNSAGCKSWCIALVSAIIVIIADKARAEYIWLSLIPIVLFLLLDAYYLALERGFRSHYNDFIRKIHSGTASIEDVFIISPDMNGFKTIKESFWAMGSISIWTFYGFLMALLIGVKIFVL